MSQKIRVGVAGFGMMGQMHLGHYLSHPDVEVVAIYDYAGRKLSGDNKIAGNIANELSLDLGEIRQTSNLEEFIESPDIDLLDFCLPTPQHADATIAALRVGKHVLCEKPMALMLEECDAMIDAQQKSGKFLLVGHCLRFWPQYVAAQEILGSGELGSPIYARFSRAGAAPTWSKWLLDGAKSGGAALDMHIHDVDTALWWFGEPQSIKAAGVVREGLPLKIDALWNYESGLVVALHGGWDKNGGGFNMAFEIACEKGTISWDMNAAPEVLVFQAGEMRKISVSDESAYGREIAYFLNCIAKNEAPKRITPQGSRLAVEITRRETEQFGAA